MAVALALDGSIQSWAGPVGFGPPTIRYTNDATHRYYIFSSHTAVQKKAVKDAVTNLDAQTDMTDVSSTASAADVAFQVGKYTSSPYNGWYAWTACGKPKNSDVCNQNVVTRNNSLNHNNQKALYCHEIGHTIGLHHAPAGDKNSDYKPNQTTCMRGNQDVSKYADIDVSRINQRY